LKFKNRPSLSLALLLPPYPLPPSLPLRQLIDDAFCAREALIGELPRKLPTAASVCRVLISHLALSPSQSSPSSSYLLFLSTDSNADSRFVAGDHLLNCTIEHLAPIPDHDVYSCSWRAHPRCVSKPAQSYIIWLISHGKLVAFDLSLKSRLRMHPLPSVQPPIFLATELPVSGHLQSLAQPMGLGGGCYPPQRNPVKAWIERTAVLLLIDSFRVTLSCPHLFETQSPAFRSGARLG